MTAFLAVGCAASKTEQRPGGTVHQWRQGSLAQHANLYWFETPSGTIVVDAPLENGEAKKLRGSIVRPYRIYITSARPERFASLDVLRKPDIPAYTTPAVATEMQNHGGARLQPMHAKNADVPGYVTPPTPAVEERTHDLIGDEVEVELLPLGPAESEASLALFLTKTGELITGDVVTGGEHLDLTWGRSVTWQDRINELKALEPKHVYPGHGVVGGPELLDQALEYLKFFHDAVAEKVKSGAPARITPADLKDVRAKMIARFPKLGRPELLDKSIPAEYAVQLSALPPAAPATPTTPGAPGTPPPSGTPPATSSAPPATPPPSTSSTSTSTTKSSSSSSGVDDLLPGSGSDNETPGKKGKKKKK